MVSTRSASEIWHPAKGDPTLKFTKILAHNMPKGYPYRFGPRDKSNMIPYYEWRGKGPPPDDIGHPGDLYLDLTPGNYALHAHTTKKWVKWVGPRTKKEGLLAHPHLKDRYLDCSDRFIGWYAESTIRRHQAKLVVSCSASGSIQKLVALERGLNGHQQETTRRNGDSNSDDDDCEEDGGHVHAKQRHPKRRRVDSGSGESARESASSDVSQMKYQIEALKSQVKELQQAKDSNVEVNIGRDDEYRSKTFDQLCSLARTNDEMVARKVSAEVHASTLNLRLEMDTTRAERDEARKAAKSFEKELEAVKIDRDNWKMKVNDIRSALNATMHQLDSDLDL